MGAGALRERALGSRELHQDVQAASVTAARSGQSTRVDDARSRIINIGEDIVTRAYEPESFESLLDDLAKEVELRNYRVTRIYDIDNIHEQAERDIAFPIAFEGYKIVEFCNLGSCVELISTELLAGVFMPLRFIVYEKPGSDRTFVSFLRPTAFSRPFDSARLTEVASPRWRGT